MAQTRPHVPTAAIPSQARAAAAVELHALATTLRADLPDWVDWGEHAARIVAVALAAIDPSMLDSGHTLAIADDGESWSLQHPLECRPNLHTCALNRALIDNEELTWGFLDGVHPVRLGSCGVHVLAEDQPDHSVDDSDPDSLLCRTQESGTVS